MQLLPAGVTPRDGVRGRAADDADGRPRCRAAYRGGVSSCTFCAIAAGHKTDQPVVAADEHTVAFLDARPVFKGHVLVIPRMHYRTLADLPPELTGPLFARVRQVSPAMAAALGDADGSFIGVNPLTDTRTGYISLSSARGSQRAAGYNGRVPRRLAGPGCPRKPSVTGRVALSERVGAVCQSPGRVAGHGFAVAKSGDAGIGAGEAAYGPPRLIAVAIERPDDDFAAGLGDEITGEQDAQARQMQRDTARGVAPDVQHDSAAGEVEYISVCGFVINAAWWGRRHRPRHRRIQCLFSSGENRPWPRLGATDERRVGSPGHDG